MCSCRLFCQKSPQKQVPTLGASPSPSCGAVGTREEGEERAFVWPAIPACERAGSTIFPACLCSQISVILPRSAAVGVGFEPLAGASFNCLSGHARNSFKAVFRGRAILLPLSKCHRHPCTDLAHFLVGNFSRGESSQHNMGISEAADAAWVGMDVGQDCVETSRSGPPWILINSTCTWPSTDRANETKQSLVCRRID
jgi:hypothetical protein